MIVGLGWPTDDGHCDLAVSATVTVTVSGPAVLRARAAWALMLACAGSGSDIVLLTLPNLIQKLENGLLGV